MLETILYTFPASPVRPAYQQKAYWNGMKAFPVWEFEGRECYVTGTTRTRIKKGWTYYNVHTIRFIDDGTSASVPVARFNKGAKAPKLETMEG